MNTLELRCPIWSHSNEQQISDPKCSYNKDKGWYEVDSPRAGGKYRISHETDKKLNDPVLQGSDDISDIIHQISDGFRAKLTTWLIEKRKQGYENPLITNEVLEQIHNKSYLPIQERLNNTLRYIYKKNQEHKNKYSHFNEFPINIAELKAYSECANNNEWNVIYKALEQYVDTDNNQFILNVKGLERLESLETNKDSRQAFVAMWFDESMNDTYDEAIQPAIEEMGYRAMRIDKKEHNNRIDDEIIAEIKRSKLLIADFSHGKDGIRGGVYYEAGFAHGLDIEVIFTCRKGDENKLHFDTRQFNHIIWENTEDLKKKLKHRIGRTLGDGPLKSINHKT